MRKIFYMMLAMILAGTSYAQPGGQGGEPGKEINVNVLIFRLDEGTGVPTLFPKHDVIGTIQFKDAEGNVLSEGPVVSQTTDVSTLNFMFEAQGSVDWSKVTQMGFEFTVLDPNNAQAVFTQTGAIPVGSVPRANYAFEAGNTWNFAGNTYDSEPMTIPELISQAPTKQRNLLAQSIDQQTLTQSIRPLMLQDFISRGVTKTPVQSVPTDFVCIGTSDPLPTIFGKEIPDILEFFYLICMPELLDFNGGAAFIIKDGEEHDLNDDTHRSVVHQTSAVYAENIYSDLGIGLFANGTLRGSQHLGRSGALGRTTGAGNGAAVWGLVGANPPSGGVAYAIFGDTQNRPGSYSAAFFGNAFHTGTWTMMSDAQLKTDVRFSSGALEKINQLRPATYLYRQDTPYSLPEGVHHGFIAQEMESVLPELVSDIPMPVSIDENGFSDETVNYKGVNYVEMIALLTAAVQELNVKVDAAIEKQHQILNRRTEK